MHFISIDRYTPSMKTTSEVFESLPKRQVSPNDWSTDVFFFSLETFARLCNKHDRWLLMEKTRDHALTFTRSSLISVDLRRIQLWSSPSPKQARRKMQRYENIEQMADECIEECTMEEESSLLNQGMGVDVGGCDSMHIMTPTPTSTPSRWLPPQPNETCLRQAAWFRAVAQQMARCLVTCKHPRL